MTQHKIRAALFDFGGVLADEGFKNGLHAIARKNKKDPDEFAALARELIHTTGYLTGDSDEAFYWNALRTHTGISGEDLELRGEILKRFTLREWMFDVLKKLETGGVRLIILSDQTNWLDELEEKHHFSYLFEMVFNSYHMGKCKRDQSLFKDVLKILALEPAEVLFVDDTKGHIDRAHAVGLNTIWFQGKEEFLIEMHKFFPELLDPA